MTTSKLMKCQHCGTKVKIPPNRQATFKYCSRACKASAGVTCGTMNCLMCNKLFNFSVTRANSAKYCSNQCKGKASTGKGRTEFTCACCSKKFNAPASTKRKYCSKACYGKDVLGKNWTASFTTVRKAMLRRGKLTACERCGYKEVTQILGVHHKDRNRKNNEPSNLEVLCPNCHSLEHLKHTPHGFRE